MCGSSQQPPYRCQHIVAARQQMPNALLAPLPQVERRVNVTAPSGTVTWLNDLESPTDVRYARWPRQLKELLQPVFPGQVLPTGFINADNVFACHPRRTAHRRADAQPFPKVGNMSCVSWWWWL